MSTAVAESPTRVRRRDTAVGIVDCDTHPRWDKVSDLKRYLDPEWRDLFTKYGRHYAGNTYPRFWGDPEDRRPPSGGHAGTDAAFMAKDHLDRYEVAYATLIPLRVPTLMTNFDLANATARAINDWQTAEWLDRDPRYRGSISVATEDPVGAAAEIRRVGQDDRYVQVMFSGRPRHPMGNRHYWPIYEACAEFGLAVESHAFGASGNPTTGTGWASYYVEDHTGPAVSMQANITSMILEGVFDRFPTLRVVSVENGFAWAPPLRWRLDNAWKLFKDELRHLTRAPSEYFADHVYFATQPVEEPEQAKYFQQMLDQYPGFSEQLVFSSDYPHWDGDVPDRPIPLIRDQEMRDKILRRNARRLYRLP